MVERSFGGRIAPAWLAALGLVTVGCSYWGGRDYYQAQTPVVESKSHTAGELLEQKKEKMRRAHGDLIRMQQTLQSLRRHRNTSQIELFEPFVRSYMEEHVKVLLSEEKESWHPELVPLDANLLFAQAAVWIELRDRWRLERLIQEIEHRFAGMDSLLIEYPAGSQSTLVKGLRDLKGRRWRL